ncbi:MAG: VOC family protein [Acidobacteriota bacterium]
MSQLDNLRGKALCVALLIGMLSLCSFDSTAQNAPPAPVGHFHHLHLNVTDPAANVEFYPSKFDCEKAKFAGRDAVWAQKSWLLFNKVSKPPAWEPVSSIWHMGWGAEDMRATYQKQLDSGTKFFEPLTDISDLARFPNFYYAYVEGPDHALIELNTAPHHHFGHLHLFSEDPVAAGEWYMKYLGIKRRSTTPPSREPRFYREWQVGPSASFMVDNVNVIIFPVQFTQKFYAKYWKPGQKTLAPTKGRVIDHVAFSFDNLAEVVERLKKDGVKIVEGISIDKTTKLKHAFVEGPDKILIELVEGQARKE